MTATHTPSHDARRMEFLIETLVLDDMVRVGGTVQWDFVKRNDDPSRWRVFTLSYDTEQDCWDAWRHYDGGVVDPLPERLVTALKCLAAMHGGQRHV